MNAMKDSEKEKYNRIPEILCPASSLEVLKCAVRYGANAVYIGGEVFGLRAKAKNFSPEEMAEGIQFAHKAGVRVYVTANILAHNYDLEGAEKYFAELRDLPEPPDALIISDPGMFTLAKKVWPEVEIHISTQANNTNYGTYLFWNAQGAKRVVSARELSLTELSQIREKIPSDMEIETFVHGAMCISYSGRCLLSNYFTGRDANHGACTHPCRWKYAVVEESRPGVYLPVEENERGTYIFNSKDLCMIEHVPDLMAAGIDSWKIEGRMKTALYVATVARCYRKAVDDYLESPEKYEQNLPWYREQIAKCTYRKFSTGFFYGKPDEDSQIYDNNTYSSEAIYLAMIDEVRTLSDGSVWAHHIQKNKYAVGDTVQIMRPSGLDEDVRVEAILHVATHKEFEEHKENAAQESLVAAFGPVLEQDSCPHAQESVWVRYSKAPEEGDLIRLIVGEE